jgi:hypothetical protein
MKAKLRGAQSQCVRAASESSRKCIDTVAGRPLGAQHGVVRGYVVAGNGPSETEMPSTMPNLLDRPAKVSRERGSRQTSRCRLAEQRILDRRPGPHEAAARQAQRCAAR